MLLNLQNGIVYGPVHSRRLGCSLGINVLPANQKVCSFNCLYCQYGWTDYSMLESVVYPAPEDIFKAIELTLTRLPRSPDYITLSGNGEPTCHPNFVSIVDGILRLRDRFSPTSQVAILSNSSTVPTLIIRESLEKLDVRIMKLDVGALKPFQTYNIPAPDVSLEAIIEGLSLLRDVTV